MECERSGSEAQILISTLSLSSHTMRFVLAFSTSAVTAAVSVGQKEKVDRGNVVMSR